MAPAIATLPTPQAPISASALSTRSLLTSPPPSNPTTPRPSDFPNPPPLTTRMSAAEAALAEHEARQTASTSTSTTQPAPAPLKSILQTGARHDQNQEQEQERFDYSVRPPTARKSSMNTSAVRPPVPRQSSMNYLTALAAAAQTSLSSTPTTPGADLPIARAGAGAGGKTQAETQAQAQAQAQAQVRAQQAAESSLAKGEGFIEGVRPMLDRALSWKREDRRREAQRGWMVRGAEGDRGYGYGYDSVGEGRRGV